MTLTKPKKKEPKLPKNNSFLLIDRILVKDFDEDDQHRLADSIGTAFYEGEGRLLLEFNGEEKLPFSNRFEMDGIRFEEPVPNLFSFNNPYGACPTCEGFGQVLGIDADLVIPDKRLSVFEGAVAPWKGEKLSAWRDHFIRSSRKFDFPIHKPVMDLTKQQYQLLWDGNKEVNGIHDFLRKWKKTCTKFNTGFCFPVTGVAPAARIARDTA